MAKRKSDGKGATGEKATPRKKAALEKPKLRTGKKRKGTWPRPAQPRVWRRTARLAHDALSALESGNLTQVRQYLLSIQAVAECADGR